MISRLLSRSPVSTSPLPSPSTSAPPPPPSSSDSFLRTSGPQAPPFFEPLNDNDENFYEEANNADLATLAAPPSTIFDNETVVENPKAGSDEESSYRTQSEDMSAPPAGGQVRGTRISELRQTSQEFTSIEKCLADKFQDEMVEALHRSSQLKGLISSELVSRDRKRFDTKPTPGGEPITEPEFSSALPGGAAAVKPLWTLFTRTLKHGIASQAYNIASGCCWTTGIQIEAIIEALASFEWFKTLYAEVESGPLGSFFSPHNSTPWDFQSRIRPAFGLIYWFLIQVAIALSDVQVAIIKYLREHGRENIEKYETAGKTVDDWRQQGQYKSGRQATDILRRTGCIGRGHGDKKEPADKTLLKGLHVSTSVVKLTNRAVVVIGAQNIVAGSHYTHTDDTVFETPCTILALASAIIETKLKEIRKLPPTGGELSPPSGYLNTLEEAILKKHQFALMTDHVCQTHEIAIVMDEIQKDFRLPKLDKKMKFSKEAY